MSKRRPCLLQRNLVSLEASGFLGSILLHARELQQAVKYGLFSTGLLWKALKEIMKNLDLFYPLHCHTENSNNEFTQLNYVCKCK